jgi:mannose-6-phosphate isomerase-like protein (cupin superfamily)
MPKTSKDTASQSETVEGYEGHFEQFDGGYTVAFETYTADNDMGPLFEGLPNNQCQAAHWGYVMKGKVAYDFGDHEETYEAGDAYYVPPGHTPKIFAGSEVIEFSPTEELNETIEVVTKNMERAAAGA